MLANIKKTALAAAVIAAATSVSAPAFARSELTIVPDFYPTMVRNFNPYLATNLRTTTDFIYEPLVVFNEMKGNTPVFRLAESYKMADDLMSVTSISAKALSGLTVKHSQLTTWFTLSAC